MRIHAETDTSLTWSGVRELVFPNWYPASITKTSSCVIPYMYIQPAGQCEFVGCNGTCRGQNVKCHIQKGHMEEGQIHNTCLLSEL